MLYPIASEWLVFPGILYNLNYNTGNLISCSRFMLVVVFNLYINKQHMLSDSCYSVNLTVTITITFIYTNKNLFFVAFGVMLITARLQGPTSK